jgi:hypothetical protein
MCRPRPSLDKSVAGGEESGLECAGCAFDEAKAVYVGGTDGYRFAGVGHVAVDFDGDVQFDKVAIDKLA